MERTDIRSGRGSDPVDLEELFYDSLIWYWLDGKVPHHMVHVDEDNEQLEVLYGYA